MFIVVRGSIVISKPVKERVEQVLARMGPGDFFGEMSLFDRSPRSATVQADSDATLLVLDREALRGSPSSARGRRRRSSTRWCRSSSSGCAVRRPGGRGDALGLEATGLDMDGR